MFSIKYLLPFFVLLQAPFFCAAVPNGSGLDLDKRAPESPPTGHNYKRRESYGSCGRGQFCKGSGSCVYSRQD
ncbi:hypothetical protein BB561_003432 [Smittium simulii]|uniref:Secreted protein n=1 Tax=Smittium simulii TaxID=133385 RepID=A0A2T9YLH1_9FUNG|nr:hypothetical protein BB561_003432 [Smittium simulii]